MFQKFSRDRWKITIFLERKSRNWLFFNFFITKVSYFVSNLNDDFHEASFEVYYVSVSQKLGILGFSPQIFFILTSVTSDTSWGQTMSLSDLNEVSNFSWRCQLSYETMFVWSVPKLECPETAISQCTEVRFASFFSGRFITDIVVNPPERKLAKCTSVQCNARLCTKRATYFSAKFSWEKSQLSPCDPPGLKEKHKHKAQVFSHKSHKNDRKKGEETKKHAWINTNANQCTMWAKLFLQENPYFF